MAVPHNDTWFACALFEGWSVLRHHWEMTCCSSFGWTLFILVLQKSIYRWPFNRLVIVDPRINADPKPPPFFVYANSWLARIYLTPREAHINGLICWPWQDKWLKDVVCSNKLICAVIRKGHCVIKSATFAARSRFLFVIHCKSDSIVLLPYVNISSWSPGTEFDRRDSTGRNREFLKLTV